MAEFFFDYGLFALKLLTIVISIIAIVLVSVVAAMRTRKSHKGHIEVTKINDEIEQLRDTLNATVIDADSFKLQIKQRAKDKKAERKANFKALKKSAKKGTGEGSDRNRKSRVFVLDFKGDMKASAVSSLRREITAVLSLAEKSDEVLVRLESGGGMVHAYGLGSSQLQRVKDRGITLTICVDKIAASGGYMMACVASKLLAAPFAIIGSIGVVAQFPNFHRLLQKNEIDFELLTAGEYKRTLTIFGENTEKGREKFIEDIEEIHVLFKELVTQHRPQIKIEEVATGEIWFGQRALDKALIDELLTSDEYIVNACEESDVFEVKYKVKKSLPEKLAFALQSAIDGTLLKWWDRGTKNQFYS
ncbi:MAG: protease SohB [Proteobacteria bacterium]|nr:protease SohB [Pseudomonadota bacterium]